MAYTVLLNSVARLRFAAPPPSNFRAPLRVLLWMHFLRVVSPYCREKDPKIARGANRGEAK